jgi:hypothetical protein
LSPYRFSRYGREALVAAAAFMVVSGTNRFLYEWGILNIDEVRAVSGFTAFAALMLVAQAAYLHRADRKVNGEGR